ncbi:MAG: helix-turn-helix domain-containing protein [Bacteroidota bacterium]
MILKYILILGALQGFMLAGVIYFKNSRQIAHKYLASLLLVISLGCLADNDLGFFNLNYHIIIWAGNSFLMAPLLYLYIDQLVSYKRSFHKKTLLHFLPFVAFKILILVIHYSELNKSQFLILTGVVLNFGLIVYNLIYIFLAFTLVRSDQNNLLLKRAVNLIKTLLWVFLIYNVIFLFRRIFDLISPAELAFFENYLYVGVAILIYFISFKIINQPNIFIIKSKYEKSAIDQKDIAVYGKKIERFFEETEDYLNPKFNMSLLAEDLKLEKHKLSQIIGGYFNTNFYDLLNYYRIQKVCDQLLLAENKKLNLFGVALNCGYNSKSTFNAAFKKVKGITPSQFLSLSKEKGEIRTI